MKRIKTSRAAEILGVNAETVRTYARQGWVTVLRTSDDPAARANFFFDESEILAFARGGAAAARAYREANQPATPKRGRGRKAGVR